MASLPALNAFECSWPQLRPEVRVAGWQHCGSEYVGQRLTSGGQISGNSVAGIMLCMFPSRCGCLPSYLL